MLEQFKNYIKLYSQGLAKNSFKTYINQVSLFLKEFPELNQDNLDSYLVSKIDQEISESSYNVTLSALRHYCNFLKLDLILPPAKDVHIGDRIFLTKKEIVEELFPYFHLLFEKHVERNKFIVLFLFYTGVRPQELANLKIEDFDFEKNVISIKHTKGKRDRKVLLPLTLKRDIKEKPYLEHITYDTIRGIFTKINTELRYKKHITAYSLRHGFAKHYLKYSERIDYLQILMGHANLETTLIYINPTQEEALSLMLDISKKKGY